MLRSELQSFGPPFNAGRCRAAVRELRLDISSNHYGALENWHELSVLLKKATNSYEQNFQRLQKLITHNSCILSIACATLSNEGLFNTATFSSTFVLLNMTFTHPLTSKAPFSGNAFSEHKGKQDYIGMGNAVVPKLHKAVFPDEVMRVELTEPGKLARKVVSRSNTRPTGRFPSMRMVRQLCWDSPAELNFMRLTECSHEVLKMSEQPCIIHYRLDGQMHSHIPDCLVKTASTPVLWEIKTLEDSRRPEILARTRFLIQHMPSHGYHYAVALAEDLRSEPRLSNARLILRLGRQPLSFTEKEYARRLFNEARQLPWPEVVAGSFAPFTLSHACRMIFDGELHLDIDRVLDDRSVLMRAASNQFQGVDCG